MKNVYERLVKKVFGAMLLVCFAMSSSATVYYVSNTGNDTNSGLSTSLPWKTLAKVNATSFVAGDQLLFKRGDKFQGSLTVKSGTSGNPITFGAYGTGANPIISGFTQVTSWTNLGSNIWESTSAVSTLSYLNIVTINGVNATMGRTPNEGSVYTVDSHNANLSITSSNLTGTPNWTGAQVVIRKELWIWQVANITSQSGSTLNYTDVYSGSFSPRNTGGFFIQADARTLDVQNEWYYNPSTKKLRIYSTYEPVNVFVPTINSIVDLYSKSNLRFENITFQGANEIACNFNACTNILIQNCTFKKIGFEALYYYNTNGIKISNNVFKNCNTSAISATSNTNQNDTIINNVVDSTYMKIGIGRLYASGGLMVGANNSYVRYNSISNTGYHGILVNSNEGQIRNNFTLNTVLNTSDGGGIYSYGPRTNLIIDGNICVNSNGNSLGAVSGYDVATGIYLDNTSANVTVSNNSVFDCNRGISASGANHITITGNTVCGNEKCLNLYNYFNIAGSMNNIVMTNNVFVQKSASVSVAVFESSFSNDIQLFFTSANNNVYARPLADNTTINYYQPGLASGGKTLAQWQTFSGKDGNSTKSPQTITSASDIQFEYNETKVAKVISLFQPMIDMKGTKYSGSITLQPFSSVVLMKDANPAKYSTEYKSICDGSSYNGWTVAGKYERTLTAKTGGDSIVTTYLTVNPKYAVSENITINAGETYNGYSTSGTYTRTLNTKLGCDSVVTTNLTVESLKTGSINATQTIELKKGYNMISTYVTATDPAVSVVTQPIVESGDLIKIQDEAGNSYENWGSFGGWVNNLGTLQTTEGYKIKVAEDCTLQVTGLTIALPLDIPLNAGWNIISFPRTDALDAMTIIQPLINQNKLIKVQDEAGNSIEDWGVYGGWKNGIGNFVPGKAYRVKLNASAVLTIQESYAKSAVIPSFAEKTSYFTSDTEGNGVDHMNINLVGLREAGLVAGDELAAFDSDICVGALKISDLQLNQGSASLVASAMTSSALKDGFKEGSSLKVVVWKQESGAESTVELMALKGSLNYLKSASTLVQLKSLTTAVSSFSDDVRINVYPNPTQGRFIVRFSTLPETGSRIEVLDLSGRKVASSLVNGLTEEINLAGHSVGMYLVKSIMGTQEKIQKLVLQ